MQSQEENWLLTEKYNGEKSDDFFSDIAALRNGAPLAYLIGHVPFLGTTIHLDSHPLIPRSETELWTEKAITEITKTENPAVLDLCAGSGAIGIAVAAAVPNAVVHFAEIEPAHVQTINKNIATNLEAAQDRTAVFTSDLFDAIEGVYDFILTNPPYIDPALDRTEASVKLHEPHLALYGGVDGMELIEKIITQAPAFLRPSGQLWIEHEPEQVAAIAACAQTHGFIAIAHNDQYNTQRYSVLTRSALE